MTDELEQLKKQQAEIQRQIDLETAKLNDQNTSASQINLALPEQKTNQFSANEKKWIGILLLVLIFGGFFVFIRKLSIENTALNSIQNPVVSKPVEKNSNNIVRDVASRKSASNVLCGENSLICDKDEGTLRGSCAGTLSGAHNAIFKIRSDMVRGVDPASDSFRQIHYKANEFMKIQPWAQGFSDSLSSNAFQILTLSQFKEFNMYSSRSRQMAMAIGMQRPYDVLDAIKFCKNAYNY